MSIDIDTTSDVVRHKPTQDVEEITLDKLWALPVELDDFTSPTYWEDQPIRDPASLQFIEQLSEPDEDLAEKPIVVGEHADIQRYTRKGSPEPKTYTARAKSLAPGAAAGAGLGAGISVLMDAASKKGLNVKRALLAAFVGAPTGAILQLAASKAAQGYRDSKASPSIRSARQLAATRGYIERPKV